MPKLSDPVVVGTDGSATAVRAVGWAADEAFRRRRPLHIVHAAQPWTPVAPMLPPAAVTASLEEAGRAILDEAGRQARERHASLGVTTELVPRSPGYALSEQARSAFEIVVGHRGAGGFNRLLLGSTGLRLAGHVPGPVVVVRGDGGAYGDVVIGIDPTADCRTALEYAFEAALLRGVRLRVVHGWRIPVVSETGYAIDLRDAEDDVRWALIRATAPLRKRHPDVEVVEQIVRDHPVSALTAASREAALVVVGARDRHGLGTVRIGSVSHGVIHHAHCPVAVVRPRS